MHLACARWLAGIPILIGAHCGISPGVDVPKRIAMNRSAFSLQTVKSMWRRCALGIGRAATPATRDPANGSDHRPSTHRSCGFGLLVGIGVERRD